MFKWLLKLYYRDNCGDFSSMFISSPLSSNKTNPKLKHIIRERDTNCFEYHNMMNNVLLATVQNCVIMHVFSFVLLPVFFFSGLDSAKLLVIIIYYFLLRFLPSLMQTCRQNDDQVYAWRKPKYLVKLKAEIPSKKQTRIKIEIELQHVMKD